MRFLNQVRYYSVNNNLKIGKDTNIELSKDTSTSDLLEFEKLETTVLLKNSSHVLIIYRIM